MSFSKQTILLFFVIVNCYSFGQGVTVQGVVLDDSTKLPIDYAQIYVHDPASNYWISTVSNLEGSFTIVVPDQASDDTLHVSLVGFESLELPIRSLNELNGVVIYLHQHTTVLPTVVVKGLTPRELVLKGLENVGRNYSNVAFSNECYYWRSIKEDSTYRSLVQGNLVMDEDIRRRHLERNVTKDSALSSAPDEAVIFLDSIENLFYFDFLRVSSGLMNRENIGEWRFTFSDDGLWPEGYLIIDGKRLDNFMSVKLLMNEQDYSFNRIDYTYNWKADKYNDLPGALAYKLKSLSGTAIYGKNLTKYNLKYLFMDVCYDLYLKRGYQRYVRKLEREIEHELVVLSSRERTTPSDRIRTTRKTSVPIIINTKDYCAAAKALEIENAYCK